MAGATVDFGAGPVALPASALLFASYDPAGALRWSLVEPAGDVRWITDIAVDACGGLYVTGTYRIASRTNGAFVRRLAR